MTAAALARTAAAVLLALAASPAGAGAQVFIASKPHPDFWVAPVFISANVAPRDVRDGGPVRHAAEGRARARALRDDCVTWLAPPARLLLPAMDGFARRWLRRSRSPYVADVETIAATLRFPGIWFLNSSYEWGCTTAARDEGGVPWLARTLDWPFPGLGRHIEIASACAQPAAIPVGLAAGQLDA